MQIKSCKSSGFIASPTYYVESEHHSLLAIYVLTDSVYCIHRPKMRRTSEITTITTSVAAIVPVTDHIQTQMIRYSFVLPPGCYVIQIWIKFTVCLHQVNDEMIQCVICEDWFHCRVRSGLKLKCKALILSPSLYFVITVNPLVIVVIDSIWAAR